MRVAPARVAPACIDRLGRVARVVAPARLARVAPASVALARVARVVATARLARVATARLARVATARLARVATARPARLAIVLLLVAAVVVSGCQATGPEPSAATAVSAAAATAPASTTAPAAAVSPGQSSDAPVSAGPGTPPPGTLPPGTPSPGVAVEDPSLIAVLPANVAGQPVVLESQAFVDAIADPAFAANVEAAAFGIVVAGNDLASAMVARPVPGVFSEAWFRDWRDSYDEGACGQSGGVAGNAEAELGGRTVHVGTCAGGLRTYHAWLAERGLLVSGFSVGDGRYGEQLMAGLRP